MNLRRAIALITLLVLTGCAAAPRWQATRRPDELDAARLLASDATGLQRDERPDEVPLVPMRRSLRPCCSFGSALRVRVGLLNIPGFQIRNILSPDSIGPHTYDSAATDTREENGLVYTCRGGFIDTAHVRDYADWTLFIAARINRQLETGGVIDLPQAEGGHRRIVLERVAPEQIEVLGRRQISAALAVWMGFQLSVWHEIATWYGWSYFGAFPERGSAFSPEDLYSNILGAKIAGPIITAENDLTEHLYNQAVDSWFEESIRFLGGVPAELGEAAMAAVDQKWWDSTARLPDDDLVLRRSIQIGHQIRPWIVPTKSIEPAAGARLEEACDGDMKPHALRHPSRIPGLDFASVLRLEIELDERLRSKAGFQGYEDVVENSDFPKILEYIREDARREFGPGADSADFE